MNQPLVSILIPVYNAQDTIVKCVESCLKQTYKNIEIVVCNDASNDKTLEKLNQYTGKIRVIKNETNSGISFSRNKLLNEAKGEFIAWIDADDWMLENRIKTQIEFMLQHNEIDICGSSIIILNQKNEVRQVQDSNLIEEKLWFSNCIFQPTVMSKNFYKNEQIFYSTEYDYMEDYELWYRLRKIKKFYNLNTALTVYKMPTEAELLTKHKDYSFDAKMNKIWQIKWSDRGISSLSESDKILFQGFLRKNNKRSYKEIISIIKTLKSLTINENKLILHYHYIRLWVKNCDLIQKIRFIKLIFSFVYLPELKAKYLI